MKTFEEWYVKYADTDEAYSTAKAAWNAATEAAKPRWISVSERKPVREGWYPMKTEKSISFEKGYFDKTLGKFDDFHFDKVTHWLEMPE